jgi:hypothetical protein
MSASASGFLRGDPRNRGERRAAAREEQQQRKAANRKIGDKSVVEVADVDKIVESLRRNGMPETAVQRVAAAVSAKKQWQMGELNEAIAAAAAAAAADDPEPETAEAEDDGQPPELVLLSKEERDRAFASLDGGAGPEPGAAAAAVTGATPTAAHD